MPSQFEELVNSGHPGVTLHTAASLASQSQPVRYAEIPDSVLRILDSDMSSTATPISPAAFAEALSSLTLASLHAKAAEIRNQRAHLLNSNTQLQEFADDEDCADAIRENGVVLKRMDERLELLRKEVVDNRGMMWVEEEQVMEIDRSQESATALTNGDASTAQLNGHADGHAGTAEAARPAQSGTLNDQELARRLQERMAEQGADDGDDGVDL